MKPVLADASAILAYLGFERGGELVEQHLPHLAITAVNLAEIITVLTMRGVSKDWIDTRVLRVFGNICPFDRDLAKLPGSLVSVTQMHGLSLGDRCCLAAGIVMDAQVLTTDKAWGKLNLGIEITLCR